MNWALNRLCEPSTWAGFAGIALAVAHGFPQFSGLATGVAAVCGALAGVVAEKGTSK